MNIFRYNSTLHILFCSEQDVIFDPSGCVPQKPEGPENEVIKPLTFVQRLESMFSSSSKRGEEKPVRQSDLTSKPKGPKNSNASYIGFRWF